MTDQNPSTIKPIESLDEFGQLIVRWHHKHMSELNHLADVPDGQSVTIQLAADAEHEDVVLTGDILKGFKAGIIVAMSVFSELPFGGIEKPADGTAAND